MSFTGALAVIIHLSSGTRQTDWADIVGKRQYLLSDEIHWFVCLCYTGVCFYRLLEIFRYHKNQNRELFKEYFLLFVFSVYPFLLIVVLSW